MKIEEYLKYIKNKLSGYFDIEERKKYGGTEYDLIAKSFIRSEKYIGSKKITIYAMESTEHVFVKQYTEFDVRKLEKYVATLVAATDSLVEVKADHMCTVITGVIVLANQIDEAIKKRVNTYKHEKSFMFGLKGWTYIRLVVVQLEGGEVVTNKRGKEISRFYEVKIN
ncbi:MAG: hypothetical protein COA82_06095 [Alkaliphilus sp.]|nr:hypothetical protein [bacterium AH-315-K05]MBN4074455.1 hypothetical protein [bacterium AH-315-E09]PHS34956.1 MAG: hypothetical protein COA82_06095 [Alkaliphilus sp.]